MVGGLASRGTIVGGRQLQPSQRALALEWAGSEFMLRWLRRLSGVTLSTFGRAEGACCPGSPEVDWLNTVHRLLPSDVSQVPRIAERYGGAGVRPWLELMPAPHFGELAAALQAVGGGQVGFLAMLERDLPAPSPPWAPAGVAVRRLAGDMDDFVWVMPEGHGVPEARREQAVDFARQQAGIEGALSYLATVDGSPAAAAVLFLAGDRLAYLASAATLPAFRRRGCQTALIERRLADAAAAGCARVCCIVDWGSQSHANLARAGFRVAYTKATWRLGPKGA